ncbi:MAG TPA: hypothetical protein VFD60_06745 [Nitrososphaeraceae archaeon]|nr:hypothetical protein [Nitrososphaeraceae archaeon]
MNQGLPSYFLPDLVVNICPLGCNGACAKIWTNENTEHRIICNCECHKKTTNMGIEKGDFVKVRQEQNRIIIEKA